MCKVPYRFGVSGAARLAFAAFAAALMAGCADSSRFIGDPLGNPFRSASSEPGASYGGRDLPNRDLPSRDLPSRELPSRDLASRSLPSRDLASRDLSPPPPYRAMRTGAIQSRPLAPPSEADLPPRRVAGYATPAHASPRLASNYAPPRTERTASIPAPSGHGSWSAEGGMAVIAANGDTAGILAQRYNVPTEALLHENGLSSPAQIQPGTRLVIPVYNANGGGRVAAVAEPASRRPHDHSSRARLLARHDQAEPRTRADAKLARREEADRMRMARAPQPEPVRPRGREAAMTRLERAKAERLAKADEMQAARKAAVRTDLAAQRPAKKAVPPVEMARTAPPPREQPVRVAKVEEAPRKATVDPTPTASLPPPAVADKVSANGNPEFRWPAHGRIIQGFKSGGNDGINIAVPEGTSVKAAESGVVAYAGSEIKGFGNLVLIRHPNGFVTAYANNGDISVRRGEQVKRGQTIAKSGQSGNVASPQLHFELRKGSTPVDPTRYLAGL